MNETMKMLVEAVAEMTLASKKRSRETVEKMFDLLADAVIGGKDVNITHFGKLSLKTRPARPTRNPSTGAWGNSPERVTTKFSARGKLINPIGTVTSVV